MTTQTMPATSSSVRQYRVSAFDRRRLRKRIGSVFFWLGDEIGRLRYIHGAVARCRLLRV